MDHKADDLYMYLEHGIRALIQRLETRHPFYNEVLVFEQRLMGNIRASRIYGDTDVRRAERAEIIDALNHFTLEHVGCPFSDFYPPSRPPDSRATAQKTLHQLRAPVGDFVGRKTEIAQIIQSLAGDLGHATTIIGIQGMGGIGKTELAYTLAQHLADAFPDAQLFIDFSGSSNAPLSAVQAIQMIIRAFEPTVILPETLAQLRAYYCNILHGRRILIFADDVKNRAQIEPLLTPAGNALLLTSRQRFALPGMQTINLKSLPPEDANQLLLQTCPRINTHAPHLAELCGRLPLALRMSATLLNNGTRRVESYIKELENERARFKQLRDPDDPSVNLEASLQWSYDALDASTQKVLCQLSIFPSSFDHTAALAIVRLDDAEHSVEEALDILYRRSLLEWDAYLERYRLHALVRVFASLRLEAAERVFLRYASYYAQVAAHADTLYRGSNSLLLGLALFDRERIHIDTGWGWVRQQQVTPITDGLLLYYADATGYIGDIRYDKPSTLR